MHTPPANSQTRGTFHHESVHQGPGLRGQSAQQPARKDEQASPYIHHPVALANVLANEGNVDDEIVLIAALLHDTVEDTDTTATDLIRKFGQDVASVVLEDTDDISLPPSERKRQQIKRARNMSDGAKLVKLAD